MESVLQQEEWKDIKGYEGFYQVSNLGRVKVIATRRKIHGVLIVCHRNLVLKPCDTGHGYMAVHLYSGERNKKSFYVHRLVAEAFCKRPDGKDEVNHIDFDRKNNRADNLEWCDHKENIQASAKMGRMSGEKAVSSRSKTGEINISIRKNRNSLLYRVDLNRKTKYFKTIEEAISYRNAIRKEMREKTNKYIN